MRCVGCGFDNPEENEFCGHCGVSLSDPKVSENKHREKLYASYPNGDPTFGYPGAKYDEAQYRRTFWAIVVIGIIFLAVGVWFLTLSTGIGVTFIAIAALLVFVFLLWLKSGRK